MAEETNEETEQIKGSSSPSFLMEAIIIFPIAIVLDLVGFMLLFFLLDDFWILDIIGLVIIGSWMLFRRGHVTLPKKTAEKIEKKALEQFTKTTKKTGKKFLKRFGLAFLGEIIPYIGGIAPCWTLAVFFELKNN